MASKGDIATKNKIMAARLKDDPYHKGSAVEARKAARFAKFMANLLKK